MVLILHNLHTLYGHHIIYQFDFLHVCLALAFQKLFYLYQYRENQQLASIVRLLLTLFVSVSPQAYTIYNIYILIYITVAVFTV